MKFLLLLILTLLSFEAFSQRKVSGVITEIYGDTIVYAVILEVGTENKTISDINGIFNITTLNNTCSLSFSSIGLASKTVRITQDTTINIVLEYGWYDTKWLSAGVKYDVNNSLFGLTFSNGYDEMPLIHFEDFSDRVIYKVNVQTNFHKDYSFGANLGWKYPFTPRIRRLSLLSAGYQEYRYPSKDFFHRGLFSAG